VARCPAKKLIVPTVHPVGPIERLVKASGFSRNYESAFIGIGTVGQRPLPKSKYVSSPFGFLSPSFFPSAITAGAYLNWFSKLSRPKGVHLTSVEYNRSLEILNREFAPFVEGGFSDLDECLKYVDWKKSPGWPYVNLGCSTKREAWDKFSTEISERAHALVRGEYSESVFIATIKDELLPAGKNPRVFCPAPFHHHLACAMLFKKACDSLTSSCHRHSSAIGANIFGRGLERLLRSLDELPFGFDADQSGCDTSWKDSEVERDFMKIGLPTQYHSGVDMVFNLAMCPRVIVGDRVLQLEFNPSGWYLTTVVNTLMTHRVIASAYLDLAPEPESITSMREHLKQINGGDDLGYSTDRSWFDIVSLAHEVARRGMFLESDVLTPRRPLLLTFFSHTLRLRALGDGSRHIYVACGRLGKILSAFNYLKKTNGEIDWQRNASRVVGLMLNLWPYRLEFDLMYPYLYHLVHHFFLQSGGIQTSEWTGVFKAIPTDQFMLALRNGHAFETGLVFSLARHLSSPYVVKRSLQSALKSAPPPQRIFGTNYMSKSRSIDGILSALERNSSLSSDGRAWLIAACDPFHDTDITLAGYPDVNTSATVVQLIKKQLQVTVPSTVTSPNNWDASIVLFPTMATVDYGILNNTDNLGKVIGSTAANAFNAGGLVVNAGPQGSVLWPNAQNTQISASVTSQFLDVSEFIKGSARVIAMGFEVVNTTADINKQGQVTAFRLPSNRTDTQLYVPLIGGASPPTSVVACPGVLNRFPPGTLGDAQLIFGSRSWAAREGSYTVCRQNSADNPLTYPDFIPDYYTPFDIGYNNTLPPIPTGAVYTPNFLDGINGQKPVDIHAPFDLSGTHYTGLSYQTTLTVNVRWLIERSPGPNEPDLVVLATPSSASDPLALELYTHCMMKMPPGVMLSENPLGEWFRNALSTVATWAPKIGNVLGNVIPGAQVVGQAVGKGAGVARNLIPIGKKLPQPLQQQIVARKKKAQTAKQPMPGSASTTGARDFTQPRNPKNLRSLPPRN